MENITTKDVILDKKMDGYSFEKRDFVASGEITVTITLGEYRRLIADNATAQQRIDKANEDKYKRDAENDALREENSKLKAELYELTKANEVGGDTGREDTEWKSE